METAASYFSFQWHITDACDQRCTHCYIYSAESPSPSRTMAWSDLVRTLDACEAFCTAMERLPYIYVTGGDPLLHKDFPRLLALLRERGIAFSVLGNPFHLSESTCAMMAQAGCERYQMSLDGLERTHDAIRRPGSYAATLGALPVIHTSGMKSVIMATVSEENIGEIPRMIDEVVRHGADVFAFARFCPPAPRADGGIQPQAYRDLLERCWERFERHRDGNTTFNLKDHLWTLFLYEKGLFHIPDGLERDVVYDGCHCGISHLTILPDGDVCACRRMPSRVGNLFDQPLAECFLGEKMDAFRDYEKMTKCARCELLRFCRGCPAVASTTAGSFYAADPQCWKDVSHGAS